VAYIVFKKDFYLNKKQIVDYLATKIEKNLFPKHYYEIKELPLLSCGKINRKAVINATPII
jgi:acyl-CoA synthetase (AMP-forming)/AMP-acid ligase II